MRSTIVIVAALALFAGCATFKELEPDPNLSSREGGYTELRNGKDNFELDAGKQYFIRFPRPNQKNFLLVLHTIGKPALSSYLTRSFDDGKGPITKIADEAPSSDSVTVYAIDSSSSVFYWVIDSVRHNLNLALTYRYVPRWRYTFEERYAEYRQILHDNSQDRSTYTSAPGAPAIESLDFAKELSSLQRHTDVLQGTSDELKTVASLFPPNIAASRDTAYLNYLSLRADLDDELDFQQKYAAALGAFKKEKDTRGDIKGFLSQAGSLADFCSGEKGYPAKILSRAREMFLARLGDAVPYYERQLSAKRDSKPFKPDPPLEPVARLFEACGRGVPPDFAAMSAFVKRFNEEAEALQAAQGRLDDLRTMMAKNVSPPSSAFYANAAVAANDLRASIPPALAVTQERYRTVAAAGMLALELGKSKEEADDMALLFARAKDAQTSIENMSWVPAETGIREVAVVAVPSTGGPVAGYRDKIARWLDASLFDAVMGATQQRLDAFVKLHERTITNVPALYADSAFSPVYRLTFNSSGPGELARRRAQIDEYIGRVRHYQFPESAIRAIYKDFGRDMGETGVDRAKAIVNHGREYRGSDKQIEGMVAECDPMTPKLIVRPKEYRRILAIPVSGNRRGVNDYVVRIRLQIPSDAQFPVFDVNVKLPRELAENAGREQWYDEITINKNPIRNEGRFRITAPTSDNDYESQITPVQMDKAGNNILEIRFKRPTYKLYEISAMAQVPIMKKN
jgi:hypothetical protein